MVYSFVVGPRKKPTHLRYRAILIGFWAKMFQQYVAMCHQNVYFDKDD